MRSFRRINGLLIPTLLTGLLCWPSLLFGEGIDRPDVVALSMDDFARRALIHSLRSRNRDADFDNARYQWMATRRELTFPSLTASGVESKAFADDDVGAETKTRSTSGTLSLTQPFLTGTSVSVEGNWLRTQVDVTDADSTSTSYTRNLPYVSAAVRQPLFLFVDNDRWRTRKIANLQWQIDQNFYERDRLSIEFDARALYYNVLLQQERADVEKKKLESSRLVRSTTEALVKAGRLAEVELARAEIRSRRDERRIQNAQLNLEKRLNEAKDFVSIPPQTPLYLTSVLEYEPMKIPLETLAHAAERFNQDLLSARISLDLARLNLEEVREGDNPVLEAVGTYNRTRDRAIRTRPLEPYDWAAQLELTWPFFDASQTHFATLQAESRLANAERNYDNQRRQLRVSVENAYGDLKRAEDQIQDFQSQKETIERTALAVRLQYRNGLSRLTDVFDAENEVRDLQLEYLGLLVDFNTARDRLKVLVGRDLAEATKEKP